MRRVTLLALLLTSAVVALAAVGGPPAYASTCADYTNQAAAQHAHDTRDADGDGIYCESPAMPVREARRHRERGRPASRPAGKLGPERLRPPECRAEHLVEHTLKTDPRPVPVGARNRLIALAEQGFPRLNLHRRRSSHSGHRSASEPDRRNAGCRPHRSA